jgi:hypothetical protein
MLVDGVWAKPWISGWLVYATRGSIGEVRVARP